MARVTGAERVQVGYVIVRFHVIVSYGKFLMAVGERRSVIKPFRT